MKKQYRINMLDGRTYRDRRSYLIAAVTKRRRVLKQRAVAELGGSCVLCGYDKHPGVLDFHHIDPATKTFGISSGGFSRSWQVISTELRKCILVCANCHREIELGLVTQNLRQYLQTDAKRIE